MIQNVPTCASVSCLGRCECFSEKSQILANITNMINFILWIIQTKQKQTTTLCCCFKTLLKTQSITMMEEYIYLAYLIFYIIKNAPNIAPSKTALTNTRVRWQMQNYGYIGQGVNSHR